MIYLACALIVIISGLWIIAWRGKFWESEREKTKELRRKIKQILKKEEWNVKKKKP